jgi:hypothetical protein
VVLFVMFSGNLFQTFIVRCRKKGKCVYVFIAFKDYYINPCCIVFVQSLWIDRVLNWHFTSMFS